MKDSYNNEKNIPEKKYKSLNYIRKLKEYTDKDKVTLLLNEYNKKQELDYFSTQKNIRLGKISYNNNPDKKKPNPFIYLNSPKVNSFHNQRRQPFLGELSLGSFSNNLSMFKRSTSLSSRKITRLTQNMEQTNTSKKNVIDNITLKRHYNNIRQRINEYKHKKDNKKNILTDVNFNIKKSLNKQEKIFKRLLKEKKYKKITEENLRIKTNQDDINDLLINKSSGFNKKNLEIAILDKNITIDNKYRNNLWNITLRNYSHNGKYEKLGYINIGSKYEPRYTFFNMNKNLEYFSTPDAYKTKYKHLKNKRNITINLNDNLYNLKTKQNLQFIDNIQNLEINGKNLLDIEEEREKGIKGNKILHKNEYLEYLFNKKINKGKISDDLYSNKIFANNYNMLDFMKNINVNSKCN